MTTNTQPDSRLEQLAARGFELLQRQLSERYPWLTPLICGFEGRADKEIGTLGTDGRTVFYDPEWLIKTLSVSKGPASLRAAYLHMLAHCLLAHPWQPSGGDTMLWDEACDLVAETLRRRITLDEERSRENDQSQKLLDRLETVTPEALIELCQQYQSRKRLDMLAGKLRRDDHSRWRPSGKKEEGFGASEAENADAAYWKELLKSAYAMLPEQVAKGVRRGLSLADFGQSINAAEENESDYRRLLRQYSQIREQRQEDTESLDYAWYTLGLTLYGNIPLIEYPESAEKPRVDDIVIALDVSGSCDGELASRFLRETCNIIRDMGLGFDEVKLRILECDMMIRHETVIHRADEVPDFSVHRVRGFGGTDFRPVFSHIEKLRKSGEMQKPRCLLYLSDGGGSFPQRAPDYDTVFVLTEEGYGDRAELPDWVRTVCLTEKDWKGEDI